MLDRGALRGAARYFRHTQDVVFLPHVGENSFPNMARNSARGALIHGNYWDEFAQTVLVPNSPRVYFGSTVSSHGFPVVRPDDRAVGRLAADHFAACGLPRLGIVGSGHNYDAQRREGLIARGAELGLQVYDYVSEDSELATQDLSKLIDWIKKIPRPVGILGSTDMWAVRVATAARIVGIAVPEQVAIVGVNNDDVYCEMSDPPLSSIELAPEEVGRLAAQLLHAQLRGEQVEGREYLVPPSRLVQRRSTDTLAISDPAIVAALRDVREHAAQEGGHQLSVDAIAKHAGIGRRTLEQRFRKLVGRTILEEATRVRISRARDLLRETDLRLDHVAGRSGFGSLNHFHTTFRRVTGESPRQFRLAARFSRVPVPFIGVRDGIPGAIS